jgi:hypothetical protein
MAKETTEQMKGLFELQTFAQLLHKREWEYAQWHNEPLNLYHAWNFFVTAEHLPDWGAKTGHGLLRGISYRPFKQNKPLLRICSHLASGSRHLIPKPSQHTSVDRTVRELRGYVDDDYVEDDSIGEEPMLVVYLTSKEVTALPEAGFPITTPDIEALWLATQVLKFWQQYL